MTRTVTKGAIRACLSIVWLSAVFATGMMAQYGGGGGGTGGGTGGSGGGATGGGGAPVAYGSFNGNYHIGFARPKPGASNTLPQQLC